MLAFGRVRAYQQVALVGGFDESGGVVPEDTLGVQPSGPYKAEENADNSPWYANQVVNVNMHFFDEIAEPHE